MDIATYSNVQNETGGASGYLTIDLAALARNYEKLAAELASGQPPCRPPRLAQFLKGRQPPATPRYKFDHATEIW